MSGSSNARLRTLIGYYIKVYLLRIVPVGWSFVLGTGFEPMKSCDARFTVATI
jgi:hypothetical protein